jgi:dolichyl-phosphate-mannose--protein O-mannosyl transferase
MMRLNALILVLFFWMAAGSDDGPVTCGSMLKLQHQGSGHHLHSHQINWGSGSGQQSVTGHGSTNDQGANWIIKSGHNAKHCEIGQAVQCGDIIRFEHIQTKENLHSHLFKAALSGQQEVSAFGNDGKGDTGDDWIVQCAKGAKYWTRGAPIEFKHKDTSKYLSTQSRYKFTADNCGGGCPIMGQTEVSSSAYSDASTRWLSGQGLYFPSKTEFGDEL